MCKTLSDLDALYLACIEIERGTSNRTQQEEEELGIIGAVQEEQYTLLSAKLAVHISDALEELPAFRGGAGLVLLKALRNALVDLNYGGVGRLVTPSRAGRLGEDRATLNSYKANAVFCVCLLEKGGFNNSQARAKVASILNEKGHRWKDGEKLNASTLYRWQRKFTRDKPTEMVRPFRTYIEKKLLSVRTELGSPLSKSKAEKYVCGMADNPVFSVGFSI